MFLVYGNVFSKDDNLFSNERFFFFFFVFFFSEIQFFLFVKVAMIINVHLCINDNQN